MKKKALSLIVIVLFFLAVIFSFDYIVENTVHDCNGADCEICFVLKLADEIFGGDKKAVNNSTFIFMPTVFISAILSNKKVLDFLKTPISLFDKISC